MSDLISRQAAITEFNCCELTPDGGIDANDAIDILERLPSAQAEIIRCKDCKFHCDRTRCKKRIGAWFDDDYCNGAVMAEREEE